MKKIFFLTFVLFLCSTIQAQEITNPNFAVASHPMFINNIHITSNQLVIKLTIENKVLGGNFCVDKNTYIENVLTAQKSMFLYSENIPVCPDAYNFTWIGEKLSFQLYFPKPSEELKYMNIVEACDQNCFSIFGIVLDTTMNKLIDDAFKYFEERNYESSETTLIRIMTEYPDYPFGNLYLNLIQVLLIQDKIEEANKYYQVRSNSNFSDKKFIIDQLKNETQLIK